MKEICLIHLVRLQNGLEPFERFLDSYRINPGGIAHDLLIVFKGFGSSDSKSEYLRRLSVFQYRILEVSDEGYDITAYFAAATQCAGEYRYLCFLNSYSVIQDSDWLSKLHRYVSQPGVGLAGATGSWQTHRTKKLFWMTIPVDAAAQHFRAYKQDSTWKRIYSSARIGWEFGSFLWEMKPFPNYHLRTNAFMISSELMCVLDCPDLKCKLDAYNFESGKSGLTSQILKLGKKVLVVGKDGIGYEMTKWNKSKTFWQAEQENILVADNQTREYLNANLEQRTCMTCAAWGE